MSEKYLRGSDCKAAFKQGNSWGAVTGSFGTNDQLPLLNESITFDKGTLDDATLQGEGGKFNHDVIKEKYGNSITCKLRCGGSLYSLMNMVMGSGSIETVSGSGDGVFDHTMELAPIHSCSGSAYHHQGTLAIGKGEFVDVFSSCKPTKMTITGNPANDITVTFDVVAYDKTKTSPAAAAFDDWTERTTKSFRFSNMTMSMSDWDSSKASWSDEDIVRISDFNLEVDRGVNTDIQTNTSGIKIEEPVEGERNVAFTFTVPTVGTDQNDHKRDFTDDVENDTRKMIKLSLTGGTTLGNENFNYALDVYMPSVYLTKGDKNISGKDLVSVAYECLLERTDTNVTLMEQGTNYGELITVWRSNSASVLMNAI